MKNQNGITLVALVITIIVLLILAGVSISLVMGNNGVLTQASNAVTANDKANAESEVKLGVSYCLTQYWAAWSTNANTTKAEHYKVDTVKNNCPGASAVTFNGTPAAGGTFTIDYTSKNSKTVYRFTVTVDTGDVVLSATNPNP